MSTEQIGLARTRDGTDLVRIGQPQRPEMAAWRYGDRFGRRRRRAIALIAAGVSLPAVALVFPLVADATGMLSGMFAACAALSANALSLAIFATRARLRVSMRTSTGEHLRLSRAALASLSLLRDANTALGWAVQFDQRRSVLARVTRHPPTARILIGADALGALRVALPALNADGGNDEIVQASVQILSRLTLPQILAAHHNMQAEVAKLSGTPLQLSNSPFALALEMALHENDERRALEGELAVLERRWREAEELAAIADELLLPKALRERFDRLRRELR